MKGADQLPLVAAELKQLNVPFTMDICGGGELEAPLRESIRRLDLQDRVQLRGVLDFRTELMPLMTRHIDLFVCCHPQGDPSCTYLETMSCGTPIIGYDNDAFTGIVRTSGVGWLTPLGRPRDMARQIANLHADRAALAAAALKAREFAGQHTFEKTMQARIDHMLCCCRDREEPGDARRESEAIQEQAPGSRAGACA
jgi:glycosyltransferase involved in cell wall biosynthesis